MKGTFIASILVLGLSVTPIAAQPIDGQSAASTDNAVTSCFQPRPLPRCRTFWVTEFGMSRFVTTPPGDSFDPRRTLITWTIGRMRNVRPGRAVGSGVFLAANDNQFRAGAEARLRSWRSSVSSVDLGVGVILLHSDTDLEIRPTIGPTVRVGLDLHPWVGVVGQAELTTGGLGLLTGAHLGSIPAAVLGVGLPVIAFIRFGLMDES